MRIFYTAVDNGDGSLGVHFYESQECIDLLEKYDFETYRGEGGDSFDCYEFSGKVETLEDVKEHLSGYFGVPISP